MDQKIPPGPLSLCGYFKKGNFKVLKPLTPVEGLQEHERVVVILCPRTDKEGLRELAGTLTHEEAEAMQKLIDEEFERIEGEW